MKNTNKIRSLSTLFVTLVLLIGCRGNKSAPKPALIFNETSTNEQESVTETNNPGSPDQGEDAAIGEVTEPAADALFQSEDLLGTIAAFGEPTENGKKGKITQTISITKSNSDVFEEFDVVICLEACSGKSPQTEIGGDPEVGEIVILRGAFQREKGNQLPIFVSTFITDQLEPIGDPQPESTPEPSPDPGANIDGTALYGTYCESCHGALANSEKSGATAAEIERSRSKGVHGSWNNILSEAEVAAIAEALK